MEKVHVVTNEIVPRFGSVEVLGKAYPKEINFAKELAAFGYDVTVRGKSAAGADLLVNGIQWELKTLESASVNAVRQNLRKGLKQGNGRMFIDGRDVGLSYGTAIKAIQYHYNAGRMKNAVEVRVLTRSGEYAWTL